LKIRAFRNHLREPPKSPNPYRPSTLTDCANHTIKQSDRAHLVVARVRCVSEPCADETRSFATTTGALLELQE
jgi:hypothetical protein